MSRLDASAAPERAQPDLERYDTLTIWLHWSTVVLVAVLWVMGETTDWLPRGPFRSGVWSVHIILGFALALVLVTRVAWRARFGRTPPPADSGALHILATLTHYSLYVLLAAVALSGIVNASYRGFSLFGLWSVPQFGVNDEATRHSINGWHELAANLVFFVALLHAAAALVHQYVWGDHLLNRMSR